MSHIVLIVITAILLIPGLVGIIFPILPGMPYMFLMVMVYALITKFSYLTGPELWYLAALTVASILVDFLSGLLGAKFGGASGRSLLAGIVGFVLGMISFPPLGGFIGMFVGVLVGEIYFFGRVKAAVRSAQGAVLGTLAGIIINLLIGLTFIGLFLAFVL